MIITIILVILVFGLLVFVHELGHFLMARRSDIEVEEFGFGFPPRLVGRRFGKSRTIYSINLVPLGGFVRLKGEDSTDKTPGSFASAPYRAKAKVLLAGVGMNLLAAYLLVVALNLTGLPQMFEGQFSFGKTAYAQPPQLLVADVAPGSPAQAAGIRTGDFVLEAGGKPLGQESELIDFTRANAGQEVNLKVKRGSEERVVKVKLKDPGSKDGFLGVVPRQTYMLKYGLVDGLITAAGLLGQMVWLTLIGIVGLLLKFPALIAGIFRTGVPEAAGAAVGPLGIFFLIRHASALGVSYLVQFAMAISVTLAVFNALPLPALDGGRLALITYQKLSKRPLSPQTENLIHSVGFVFLMLLVLVITIFDLRRFK